MDSPPREHRAIRRVVGDTVGPVQLRAESLTESFLALVRDVSVQGIGLIAKQPLISGTSLQIEAGPTGKSPPTSLLATVCHVEALPDGQWLLGCSLSRHLTLDDLEVLG